MLANNSVRAKWPNIDIGEQQGEWLTNRIHNE